VPARGGSKRIPRKNIRPFLGVPIILRALDAVFASGRFAQVVVSTDDDDIAGVAQDAGAGVIARPADLAADDTPTAPVIEHAIREIEGETKEQIGDVCVVYPTAVFTTAEDLAESHEILASSEHILYVATAVAHPSPIHRALRLLSTGDVEMLWPDHRLTRTQDLETTYFDAGQFYWGRRRAWLDCHPLFDVGTRLHLLAPARVWDIDTPEDWERAEIAYEIIHQAP
jgi:N-acylneuraminate cytidylyltransferase